MANLNRCMFIGRLTRDPEARTFANGGKVVSFGIAVNNKRKVNGEWVDQPMFLDAAAFNSEKGRKLADVCEQYLAKGKQAYFEGKLHLEQWDDKNGGGKRSKHKLVLDEVQLLDPRPAGDAAPSKPPAESLPSDWGQEQPMEDEASIPF